MWQAAPPQNCSPPTKTLRQFRLLCQHWPLSTAENGRVVERLLHGNITVSLWVWLWSCDQDSALPFLAPNVVRFTSLFRSNTAKVRTHAKISVNVLMVLFPFHYFMIIRDPKLPIFRLVPFIMLYQVMYSIHYYYHWFYFYHIPQCI